MADEKGKDDERLTVEADGEFQVVGRGPSLLQMGARLREEIEKLGGVPAFDDRTLGRLSAIHTARNAQYFFNMQELIGRVMRRTTLGNKPTTEQQ